MGEMASVGICSRVIEWVTHIRMYVVSSPTSVNHGDELIYA